MHRPLLGSCWCPNYGIVGRDDCLHWPVERFVQPAPEYDGPLGQAVGSLGAEGGAAQADLLQRLARLLRPASGERSTPALAVPALAAPTTWGRCLARPDASTQTPCSADLADASAVPSRRRESPAELQQAMLRVHSKVLDLQDKTHRASGVLEGFCVGGAGAAACLQP